MTKLYRFILLICVFGMFSLQADAAIRWIADSDLDAFTGDGNEFENNCNPSIFTKTCTDSGQTGKGIACGGKYKECQCKPEFKYEIDADCPNSKETIDTTSSSCTIGGKSLYSACKCPPRYVINTCGANNLPQTDICGGKIAECLCPSGWTTFCSNPPLKPAGLSCTASLASTNGETVSHQIFNEKCECPAEYIKCDNGPKVPGVTQSCTETNGDIKYKECKPDEPAMTCNEALLAAYPTAVFVNNENDLSSGEFEGTMILMNDITTTKTLKFKGHTLITSPKSVSSYCTQDAKIKVEKVFLTKGGGLNDRLKLRFHIPSEINKLDIASESTYARWEVRRTRTMDINHLGDSTNSQDNIWFLTDTTYDDASMATGVEYLLTFHNSINIIKSAWPLQFQNVHIKGDVISKGGLDFRRGNSIVEGRVDAESSLYYGDGTHTIGKGITVNGSGFTLAQTQHLELPTRLTVNVDGTEDIGLILLKKGYYGGSFSSWQGSSNYISVMDFNNSGIVVENTRYYNAPPLSIATYNDKFELKNVKILNLKYIKYKGDPLFNIYFAKLNRSTATSEIHMMDGSVLRSTVNNSKPEGYIRLNHAPNLSLNTGGVLTGITVVPPPQVPETTITSFGDLSQHCGKAMFCNNIEGIENTCEYPYRSVPEYVYHYEAYMTGKTNSSGTQSYFPRGNKTANDKLYRIDYVCDGSCVRDGQTYYGGRCSTGLTCEQIQAKALAKCLELRFEGEYKKAEKIQACNDMYAPGGDRYDYILGLCKAENALCTIDPIKEINAPSNGSLNTGNYTGLYACGYSTTSGAPVWGHTISYNFNFSFGYEWCWTSAEKTDIVAARTNNCLPENKWTDFTY